jgi:hypothetical protein
VRIGGQSPILISPLGVTLTSNVWRQNAFPKRQMLRNYGITRVCQRLKTKPTCTYEMIFLLRIIYYTFSKWIIYYTFFKVNHLLLF